MRSARPFDYKPASQLTYSLQAGNQERPAHQPARLDPGQQDSWDTNAGEFGLLVGAAFARNKSTTDGFETIGWTNANMTCPVRDPVTSPAACNGFNWATASFATGVTSNGLTPARRSTTPCC
jgi:hypothetical protein